MLITRGDLSVPQFPHLYSGVMTAPAAQSCFEG